MRTILLSRPSPLFPSPPLPSSPFLRLNLVAEVMESWFGVQRHWMYLEGIFLGSEDIRSQLPEEAKRFSGVVSVEEHVSVAELR